MNPTSPIDEKVLKQEIFTALGAANLPQEMQEEVLAVATGPIIQAVTLAILMKLPVGDVQEKFKAAFDKGDSETVQRIMADNIPDADKFITEEIQKASAEFRTLFESEMK